ncbi:lysophospholipid acyltransferase family protein [Microvirga sp. W0021]|uniref:Lysophospholipid acyltransferase family protein n=2 Tax=Hohaiivirga grylli TaxID=3133970 RepID=A0ABV0BHA2_9HYPH
MKKITRSRAFQETVGYIIARYLGLVRRTNKFVMEPPNAYDSIGPMMPVIAAMWHGQHFMIHFAKRPEDKAASLISRSRDGELNAIALKHLGVRGIRGSGARGRDIRAKGGVSAMRKMLRALKRNEMVVLTADVPKKSRVCGMGIITLAQMSGRPIVPVAVVTSRRIDFNSWDHASIGLPFGKGAIVMGPTVYVPEDADSETMETLRKQVEDSLDAIHLRAYELVGSKDPGAKAHLVQKLPGEA